MACDENIRSRLFPGNAGGTLIYVGYSATNGGGYGSGGTPVPPSTGDNTVPYPCVNLVNFSGYIAGFYKFRLEGTDCQGNAISEESQYQVVAPSNAGDPAQALFCVSQNTTVDLNDWLAGETMTGEWSVNPASEGTEADNALFNTDGDLDLSQFTTPGFYYFDYETGLDGIEPGFIETDCPECFDKSTVEVVITADPEAGTGGSYLTCVACPSFSLFGLLTGADPNGSWSQLSGGNVTISNDHIGTIDPPTSGVRVFRYAVGSGACADTVDVTVETVTTPYAGTDGSLTVCEDNGTIDLFALISGEQSGGYWYNAGPTPPAGIFDPGAGTYTPALGDGVPGSVQYDFRYAKIIPGVIGECGSSCDDESQALVTVQETGYAGENAGDSGCINDSFNIINIIEAASSNPLTSGEVYFLGYDANCTGNNQSGTFNFNGNYQSWNPMTYLGSNPTVSALSGWGCYQFMHYTPNQGAACADTAFVEINIGPCCTFDYTLNYNPLSNELCVSGMVNCGDCACNPPVDWYYSANGTNFTLITGTSGNCLALNQGDGVYKAVITCGSCPVEKTYTHTTGNNCGISASVTESGGNLNASSSGCSGVVTYSWEYSVDGISGWSNVGSGSTHTPAAGGYYRLTANCPDDQGCTDIVVYHYTTGCSLTVTLNENAGTLNANPQNGSGPYSYEWGFSPTGNAGSWTTISGATSSSYTPTQSGWFRVIVTDSQNCTAVADIQFTLPSCNTTAAVVEINNGTQLQVNYSGTSSPVIRWQFSLTGSGWTSLPQFDDLQVITPDQGNGWYRAIVYDGSVGNCPAEDSIEWMSGCNVQVTINQGTCGATDVDVLFFIDTSSSVSGSEYSQMKTNIDATIDDLDANPSINPRFMVVHYGTDTVAQGGCPSGAWDHSYDITVNWTTNAATAKSFSRPSLGPGDFFNESLKELYDHFQGGNIPWRAGADRHIAYFTDALRGQATSWIVNQDQENGDCADGSTTTEEAPLFEYADNFKNNYSAIFSVVRYRQGNATQNADADAAAASIASQGGDYNGTVESGAPTPRRLYQLTWGDPVPSLANDIACVEFSSTVTGCSGTVVYTWQYRTGPGATWTNLPQGTPTIEVSDPGQYRLKIDCGGCNDNFSNIVTI